MFGTEYELEDHYEWHDDMQYRNEVDRLHPSPINTNQEPEEVIDEAIYIGGGIWDLPLITTSIKGSHKLKPRKDGELAGISFISREDVERYIAPHGVIKESTRYLSIPSGLDYDAIRESLPISAKSPLWVATGKVGTRFDSPSQPADPIALPTSSTRNLPIVNRPLTIMSHGIPGRTQITDVSGRKRWIRGDASGSLLASFCGTFPDCQKHLDAAIKLEESGELQKALDSWIQVLDSLTSIPGNSQEQRKLLAMMNIALLGTKLSRFDQAVDFNCRALDLSQKLYGKDGRNNFVLINDIAILFEEKGRLEEAASLYRRSLAGRLDVLGPTHPDSLMTMQELGNINNALGNPGAARPLLEKAYIGYENLLEPDEKMAMVTLNNLAGTYGTLGLKERACALLEPSIPRIRESLGLDHPVTAYSIRILLQCSDGPAISEEVLKVIKELEEDMSEHGMTALMCLGDFYNNHRQFNEAVNSYRKVFDQRKFCFGDSDAEALKALHSAARCLLLLQRLPDAEEAYEQLSRLTANSIEHQYKHLAANRQLQYISKKRKELIRWGLDKPGTCPCGVTTTRLCSCCNTKNFCSQQCEQEHKSTGYCYPSVTPAESVYVLQRPFPSEELEPRFRTIFSTDPLIKGSPRLLSSEAYYINPKCLPTLRIWKDPSKLVSYYFNSQLDVRVSYGTKWRMSTQTSLCYLYAREEPLYLLVAPGEKMLKSFIAEREATTGIKVDMKFPDTDMIEYLQAAESGSALPELAVIVMEWDV